MTQVDFSHLVKFNYEISATVYVESIFAEKLSIDLHLVQPCRADCPSVNTSIVFHRELDDPVTLVNAATLVFRYNRLPDNYTPFKRDFLTGVLSQIDYTYVPEVKDSIVFIRSDISVSEYQQVADKLATLPNILPSRMVWPI